MNKNLILVGGGGHCKSVIDVAESAGYHIIGIIDKPSEIGKKVLSYSVIGCDDDIHKYVTEAEFIITVGQIKSNAVRRKLSSIIENAGGRMATIIASDATVSKYATIGEGTVIMHKAVVNAGAIIGKCSIINTMAVIEHDVNVGDFCHVSTGAMVNGECVIGNNVFIGSQSVLAQCVSIADGSIVSAGSFVKISIV